MEERKGVLIWPTASTEIAQTFYCASATMCAVVMDAISYHVLPSSTARLALLAGSPKGVNHVRRSSPRCQVILGPPAECGEQGRGGVYSGAFPLLRAVNTHDGVRKAGRKHLQQQGGHK